MRTVFFFKKDVKWFYFIASTIEFLHLIEGWFLKMIINCYLK